MPRILLFTMLFILLFSTCRNDDDQPSLATCADGDTYSIDLSFPLGFLQQWIWLSDPSSGALAFQTELQPFSGTPIFLNFEEACTSNYTLSIGINNPNLNSVSDLNTEVVQFAEVPEGMGISQPRSLFLGGGNVILVDEVIITDCPPFFALSLGNGEDPNQYSEYNEAERILQLYYVVGDEQEDHWLAIHSMEDEQWYGQVIPSLSTIGSSRTIAFDELDFLIEQSTNILTEETLARAEVRIITDTETGQTVLMGAFTTKNISLPMPEALSGPLLLTIETTATERIYETQKRYDSWPTEIEHNTTGVELTDLNFNYPQLNFTNSGADLVILNSGIVNTQLFTHVRRSFFSPTKAGGNNINLPAIGTNYALSGEGFSDKYEGSFQNGSITAIHYPHINGDYATYLRRFWGFSSTLDPLLGQEYEKLTLPLF